MFYKILKNFFLKKNVTKRLQNQQPLLEHQKIETIGLLVDETYFSNTASLVEAISSQGFRKEQITILVYKDKIKSKEVISEPFLSLKSISLSGEINKPEVVDFLEKNIPNKLFDMYVFFSYDVLENGGMYFFKRKIHSIRRNKWEI